MNKETLKQKVSTVISSQILTGNQKLDAIMKLTDEVKIELLENIIESMRGVYSEYHKDVVRDMLNEITNPMEF